MQDVADIDKLVMFLRAHRGERLCDDCIHGLGGIDSDADTRYLVTILVQAARMTQYRLVKTVCQGCARRDLIVTYVG